uniref:Uncharacterized protein n=1 Tax=Theileria parva TaxID=5875 RepID=Q4N3H8_THEPA|eukprot:XP_764047.1 hypothetical protein [Theileria parva strain Muguga]
MSLDVYNLTPKELKHLNSSLSNYKSKGLEILVEPRSDGVLVSFRCVLSPSEVSDYYSCNFEQLQYRVILTEWHNNILQNSSTLTTKHNQLTLKSLTEGWRYMITVHLEGNNKTLSTQTEFTHHTTRSTESTVESVNSGKPVKLCNIVDTVGEKSGVREYRLNIGLDEGEYLTCKFSDADLVEEVVDNFMKENKLKSFLKDSLTQTINALKSSQDSIKTLDLTDLI